MDMRIVEFNPNDGSFELVANDYPFNDYFGK